jgi:hypothetical protein
VTATITELRTLDEVLAYCHPGVIRRFCDEQDVSYERGEEVFQETLKWLYLCYRYAMEEPEGFVCSMHPEILLLDEMWHCFVLYTRDYADFCENNFGFFLHHQPINDGEGEPLSDEEIAAQLTAQFSFVHRVLGEGTLLAWYEEGRYATVN